VIPLIPNAVHQFARGDWQRALDLVSDAITSQRAPERATARLWLPEGWKALILLGLARLDEAFPLIEAGMQAAQREGVSANLRIWSMIRARALLSAGRLADASAEAEAAIEMSDEMGDGTYGYINHIARYVLGQVALHTGDPAGLVQARRAAERLRGAVACQSTQRLGGWLTALIMDAEGDPAGAAQHIGLDPLGHRAGAGVQPSDVRRRARPRRHPAAGRPPGGGRIRGCPADRLCLPPPGLSLP
jgi:hypothetical protein